eukprot:8476702-Lingulodinium_polyedra.AAC.1
MSVTGLRDAPPPSPESLTQFLPEMSDRDLALFLHLRLRDGSFYHTFLESAQYREFGVHYGKDTALQTLSRTFKALALRLWPD